ncbi:IS701 family transposase [Kineococcus sp. SYSU DK018]|uniref:IS701 family transposase n=1 Tax=Kineococcus sp. SYSU DK018 TaxID=3383139 RepID=UPI003D7CFE65
MTPEELAEVRGLLEDFAAEVFEPLVRVDQRAKGQTYLRGLLLDGARKSMQPMAERLGVDHQGLQQFVSSSTWDVTAVRSRIAAKAVEVIEPVAWVIDDTGFPKVGTASPGVARQYSGTLGKVGNCQIGVSVHAVTDTASCPLDWRLLLPAGWDPAAFETGASADLAEADRRQKAEAIRLRRSRAGIPEAVGHRPKRQLALDMLEELERWGQRPPAVAADAGYGNNADLRDALSQRGLEWIMQVESDLTAHPAEAVPQQREYSGLGPRGKPRYRGTPTSLRSHALDAGREAIQHVRWREGSRDQLTSSFLALRVRPAGRRATSRLAEDGSLPEQWLLADWPEEADEPVKYWLSNLPVDMPLPDLVRLAKIRWRIEHDYRELKTALGLDHFEGRTWTGWHRHVTLVTAAHLFRTLLRANPKARGAA